MKKKLLREIASEATSAQRVRPRLGWFRWGIGAGALAAAGLLLVVGLNIIATRQEIHRLEQRVTTLRSGLAEREETVRLLSDPQIKVVQLAGLPPSPGATARLFWNPATRTGLLFTTGLPPNPRGKAYEFWAIAGKEAVPAGVFTVSEGEGRALLRVPLLPGAQHFDKFAVTLEPAGGLPQPSGPMHLLGSL